jgi:antitoxin component of RelBE/YafQ-DinJ toxin-antitoxin module
MGLYEEKTVLIQFKVRPELREDVTGLCKKFQMPRSVLLRMLMEQVVTNLRQMPDIVGVQTPAQQINLAANDISGNFDLIRRQLRINPRLY